jgi:O-antigen ligase
VATIPLLIATVRTSWIGALGAIFMYFYFLRIQKQWIRYLTIVLMVFVVIGITFKGETESSGKDDISQNATLTEKMIKNRTAALANPLQEYSIKKRMEIWSEIWYFAIRNPLGRGQGTHGYAHSYYFQILGEIGFLGVFSFLGILFFGFKYGFAILKMRTNRTQRELTMLMVSMVFMFSLLNLTGTHLHTNPGDIYFWFALGVLARIHREVKTAAENSQTLVPNSSAPLPTIASKAVGSGTNP